MYAEFATDPVVQALSFDDQRHFVVLLCLKCSGVLDKKFGSDQARYATLRNALGLDGVAFQEARTRLCEARLINYEWQPVNWDKRQYKSDINDPTAAERMRRYRQRNATVTLRPPDSDTDTDTEVEKREVRAKRSPTATRIPSDFILTDDREDVAKSEGVDPQREFPRFCDYWRAASGARARKHDWDATWRNWCRKASDYKPGVPRETAPTRTWRPGPEDSGPC